ncbi:hypothetical protein GCM10010446_66380 [Streptomyces enissocaesilis]|uniref:Major facilitator superfamily (MFS) profile domain-containing protein n=1 Tax=Streptomyces enissocaesilis TaxID=332589 RepID=A0ABN3XQQ1_9ACTN
MPGFHAAYSLGGSWGPSLAWVGAHGGLSLVVPYLPVVVVLLPAVLGGSRWYVDGVVVAGEGEAASGGGPGDFKLLLPLYLVMVFARIGDSTVSNWSAECLQDVLGSSEQAATLPCNAYMVTTLVGRAVGDLGGRRFGAVAVVRGGTLLAAGGFAVVAEVPGVGVGMPGFTMLGFGLCVIVPQTFAAAGRLFRGAASDAAVARPHVFDCVGFLVGAPLVGALGRRGATGGRCSWPWDWCW